MEYQFTTENFEAEVLQSPLPVLVDFYADWCGPCKMMAPVVKELAEQADGRLKVGKCDITANMPLAQKYRIANIPAFKIFKNGQPIADMVGAMGAEEFAEKVEAAIS